MYTAPPERRPSLPHHSWALLGSPCQGGELCFPVILKLPNWDGTSSPAGLLQTSPATGGHQQRQVSLWCLGPRAPNHDHHLDKVHHSYVHHTKWRAMAEQRRNHGNQAGLVCGSLKIELDVLPVPTV